VEVAPPTIIEPKQEEDVVPSVIDPMLLSLVHQSIIQQHVTSGDLPVTTAETEPVSPIRMTPEQSEDQLEPEAESSLVPSTPPIFSSTDLVMVSEPARQEIIAAFIFPMGAPRRLPSR